jgi:hypothetical protein
MSSPTEPWSAKASNVLSGIVLTVNGAASALMMAADGGDAEEMIVKFAKAGIDYDMLGTDLQREAAESFVKDWNEMLKNAAFKTAG